MNAEPLRIGSAARALGTTTRTLRYYEECGLLRHPERSPAGQRRYEPADLERARTILALRRLGLPLQTIRDVLDSDAVTDLLGLLVEKTRLSAASTRRRPAG